MTGVSEEQELPRAQLGLGLSVPWGPEARLSSPWPRGCRRGGWPCWALCSGTRVPSRDGGQHAEPAPATAHPRLSRLDPCGELERSILPTHTRHAPAGRRAGHSLRHRAFPAGRAVDRTRCQGSRMSGASPESRASGGWCSLRGSAATEEGRSGRTLQGLNPSAWQQTPPGRPSGLLARAGVACSVSC